MLLYRPVGLEELGLLYDVAMRAFPPRLPEQPIFYPVTNEGYARRIAEAWNTKSGSCAGFVTRFAVDDVYASRFPRRVVGAREHEELWVPAEALDAFNRHIEGPIEVVSAAFGEGYRGHVPDVLGLRGKSASEQLRSLALSMGYSAFDFGRELAGNHRAVFLNFFFWERPDFAPEGLDTMQVDATLRAIEAAWALGANAVRLGTLRR